MKPGYWAEGTKLEIWERKILPTIYRGVAIRNSDEDEQIRKQWTWMSSAKRNYSWEENEGKKEGKSKEEVAVGLHWALRTGNEESGDRKRLVVMKIVFGQINFLFSTFLVFQILEICFNHSISSSKFASNFSFWLFSWQTDRLLLLEKVYPFSICL